MSVASMQLSNCKQEREWQRQRQSDSRERARAKGSCDLSIITAIAEVTFHVRVCVCERTLRVCMCVCGVSFVLSDFQCKFRQRRTHTIYVYFSQQQLRRRLQLER